MLKQPLSNNTRGTISPIAGGKEKSIHNIPKGISPKVNVPEWLEFDPALNDVTIEHFSHNNMAFLHSTFPDVFVHVFKIVVDSWKFTMLLLYILWDDWPIFMISGSNKQLQQLEYTLLKPDCHSWGISKMQTGREDTLEERYAIKLFWTRKKCPRNVWNASDCFLTILH